MNKIKDFIYDYNDVLVVLIIVLLAGGVVLWRIDEIMRYPEYLAAQEKAKTQTAEVDFSNIDLTVQDAGKEFNKNPEDVNSESLPDEKTEPQQGSDEQPKTEQEGETKPFTAPTEDVVFEVPSGVYGQRIAELLQEAGLIESSSEFLKVLSDMKADTKLKAGKFKIPAGSSIEDIVKILTK